jgi:hypothetical protein
VGSVIRQVHFAFRADGSGFRGGDAAYEVQASEYGVLRITPFQRSAGAPLELETTAIRRTFPLPVRAQSVRTDARAQLDIDRGVAIEHLRNTREGLEQSWMFASRPSGNGDMVIRVRAAGLSHSGDTPQGLHFLDAASGLGLRYGRANWIDAVGARTAVDTLWAANGIEIRIPASLVDRSAFPAAVDPIISPEFGMDQPIDGPAPASQDLPDIASDGTNYLVVWSDNRNSSGPVFETDIYAARVSPVGTVLDPTGIRLTFGTSTQAYQPKVVWDGASYLVVWVQTALTSRFIRGARVTTGGAPAGGFVVSRGRNVGYEHAIAVSGAGSLVVWNDFRNSATTGVDLFGARIAIGGGVIDAADLPISTAASNQYSPAVASTGTDFLVTWADDRDQATNGRDLYALRLGTDAIPLTAEMPVSTAPGDQNTPAAASDGTAYLVVWSDGQNAATSGADLYAARIDTSGVLDVDGIPLVNFVGDQLAPDLVADASGSYYLVWQTSTGSGSDVFGASVQADALVLARSAPLVISAAAGDQTGPTVATNGAGHLVAWTDTRNVGSEPDVYAARIDASGALLDVDGFPVSLAIIPERWPAVATNGTDYLVAWEDGRPGAAGIWGVRVDATGIVLDPSGIPISTGGLCEQSPKVASNGSDYLLVWQDYRNTTECPSDFIPPPPADIYGARVSAAGAVLDPAGIAIATSAADEDLPSVASNGSDYLVAWQQNFYNSDIYGARVSGSGAVLDTTPISISTATGAQYFPAIAWDGTDYLAAWQDSRNGNATTGPFNIYGARVSAAGSVLDPSGIAISTAPIISPYPLAIAGDGSNALVVWSDGNTLYGTRLGPGGSVLDPAGLPISTTPSSKLSAAVAWSGATYVVVWGESSGNIYGTYFSDAGDVLFPDGFLITAGYAPAVASLPGSALVAYQGTSLPIPRIAGRIVTPDACGSDSDCTAGSSSCLLGACFSGTCGHRVAAGFCFVGGACRAAGDLDPSNACKACQPAASPLGFTPVANGTACDDGNACTMGDTCQNGTCRGSSVSCIPPDQCHNAACDPTTGNCSSSNKVDGTPCDDGNVCTVGEICIGGVCTNGAPATCVALDQCHDVGVCSSQAGGCTTPNKADGTACNDGNACTSGETCQSGVCGAPTSTVVCAALDECHVAGTCNPASGTCSNPAKADNSPCAGGTCIAGVCTQTPDASSPDAPPADAASLDAGLPDASQPDASQPDAALPDSSSADARMPDAPTMGTPDGGAVREPAGGCGCHVAHREGQNPTGAVAFCFVALVCALKRRANRRSRRPLRGASCGSHRSRGAPDNRESFEAV